MDEPKKRKWQPPDIFPSEPSDNLLLQLHLNQAFAAAFGTTAGAIALEELRRLSVGRAMFPPFDEGSLQYLEGARALFRVIANRVESGKARKPNV